MSSANVLVSVRARFCLRLCRTEYTRHSIPIRTHILDLYALVEVLTYRTNIW